MIFRNKHLDLQTLYVYFKFGYIAGSFLISPLNLIILSYNFLFIKEYIPLYIYVVLFFGLSAPIAILLGVHSWKKGEHNRTIDLSIKYNHFIGSQARAWIKFVDGDLAGSKKEMEKYVNSGVK